MMKVGSPILRGDCLWLRPTENKAALDPSSRLEEDFILPNSNSKASSKSTAMSRREGRDRDSDSRRQRSRFDREPSPKRSRRDGKPETERASVGDHNEKQRRRLQDALSLEAPSAPDSSKIVEGGTIVTNKESDRKNDGHHEGANKHSSNPTQVPRSKSYFQHDERGSAAQAGRSCGRRAATERGWWRDAKDQHYGREAKTYETRTRDEKPQGKQDGNGNWRHDRYFDMEADPQPQPPATRKRPAFSEKKITTATQNTDNTAKETEKGSHSSHHVLGSERREYRDRNPRYLDRQDRFTAGDQFPKRREAPRGGGDFRGRDRFSGRQGYRAGGTRAEKWKHDLFDEASKSPPRKNEEDQIAKVESLLAS